MAASVAKPFSEIIQGKMILRRAGLSQLAVLSQMNIRVYATLEDYEKKRLAVLNRPELLATFTSSAEVPGDHSCRPRGEHIKKWSSKDSLLVLACDGVWDVFSSTDGAVYVWNQVRDEKADLEDACRSLLHASISRGSQDNLTSMAIVVKGREAEIEMEDVKFIDTNL